MAEVDTLICVPVDEATVPGSEQRTADCGHQVWIAPAGLRMLEATPEAQTICWACVDPADVTPGKVTPVPGMLSEFAENHGIEKAAALKAFMQHYGVQTDG